MEKILREVDEEKASPPAQYTDAELSESSAAGEAQPGKRHATVYDAVAGRVLNKNIRDATPAIKHSTKEAPYGPDEVLFRRKDAPERYAEHDIYFSHERDLPQGGQGALPDSDLLKAIHSYSSSFYEAQRRSQPQPDDGNFDEGSMDETALLAFGILLEEAGREVLGRRGDLVFTEPAGATDLSTGHEVTREPSPRVAAGNQEAGSRVTSRKRRRVVRPESRAPGS